MRSRYAAVKLPLSLIVALMMVAATGGAPALAQDAQKEKMTDPAIRDAVDDEFLYDQAVPFNKLDVDVEDGVVTISGKVNNVLAAQRATRIAETVKGVRSVVNNVKVRPSDLRTASAIRQDAKDALLRDPATDSYELNVKVDKKGIVTLSGTVESWPERKLAEKVVKGVRGVTGVKNNVKVMYETERPDYEIKPEVEQRLEWDTLVDDALIDVTVDDGEVTLGGIVGSAAEKRRATADAWVAGVRAVRNDDLEVKKWAKRDELREQKYAVKSDKEIKDALEDALMYDPRVFSFNVNTKVDDGVVVLRGKVDNLKAKRAASKVARNTVGVLRVKNRLKVRPVEPMSDEKVADNVREALQRDPYVESYELTVSVNDGTARLYGTVDSSFEKAQADDVAARVNGVIDVRNNITVDATRDTLVYDPYVYDWYVYDYDWYNGYEPAVTLKTDREIKEDINDEMWWSPFVDANQVNVHVDDGVATLDGTVDSWSEYRAARENAFEGGATWVDNDLTVRQ